MHNSFNPEVKFHIDVKQKTDKGYRFAGWAFHQSHGIAKITFKDENASYSCENFLNRKDVQEAYPGLNNSYVGFDFTFESNQDNPEEDFQLLVTTDEYTFEEEFLLIAKVKKPKDVSLIGEVNNIHPSIIAVDNFYKNPDEVREYALTLDFQHNKEYHKGQRTLERTFFNGTYEFLEDTLKKKITSWDNQPHNGVFQFCTAEDQLVYHTDGQQYAAVVFLTPNAPVECGTSFFQHKGNGLRKYPTLEDCEKFNKSTDELYWDMFQGNFYDKTPWELVDTVGNVYNRMAIWDAKLVHAATQYFGSDKLNSRLFHMFFFDAE